MAMLAAVKGYYNGSQIVMKEKIKMIREGETLFFPLLSNTKKQGF